MQLHCGLPATVQSSWGLNAWLKGTSLGVMREKQVLHLSLFPAHYLTFCILCNFVSPSVSESHISVSTFSLFTSVMESMEGCWTWKSPPPPSCQNINRVSEQLTHSYTMQQLQVAFRKLPENHKVEAEQPEEIRGKTRWYSLKKCRLVLP